MRRLLCFAFFCALIGCGKVDSDPVPVPSPTPLPTPAPAPTPSGYQVVPVENGGSLSIKFRYLGRPPRYRPTDDPHCNGGKPDDIVVGPEKELRDAVAYLDIFAGKDFPESQPPLFNQINCMFKPHVAICRANEAVTFRSSDPPLHNIHILAFLNPEMNQSIHQETSTTYTPRFPEFIKAKCDIHPWMSAYLVVPKHPYYAISDVGGLAELTNIPAGKYKLNVWHGSLGELSLEIEIRSGEKTEAIFEFPAP